MALRKVKGNFERMFDKNLTDLVRGIRNNKENEVEFFFYMVNNFLKFSPINIIYNPTNVNLFSLNYESMRHSLHYIFLIYLSKL